MNNKTSSTTPKSKTVTGKELNIRSLSSKWFNNDQHIYSALQKQHCTCWRLSLLDKSLFISFVSSLCIDLPVQPVFHVLHVPGTCTSPQLMIVSRSHHKIIHQRFTLLLLPSLIHPASAESWGYFWRCLDSNLYWMSECMKSRTELSTCGAPAAHH